MNLEKISSVIESILFVSSEPMKINDLMKYMDNEQDGLSKKEIKLGLSRLQEKYSRADSGLSLLKIEDSYQIISKVENNTFVEKILIKKRKKPLSQAALEVLSIVAFSQPVTKLEIDEIRGVKSDSAIASLVENQLIYECGRLDKIGKPILFGTTDNFLKEFGLNSIKDLTQNQQIKMVME